MCSQRHCSSQRNLVKLALVLALLLALVIVPATITAVKGQDPSSASAVTITASTSVDRGAGQAQTLGRTKQALWQSAHTAADKVETASLHARGAGTHRSPSTQQMLVPQVRPEMIDRAKEQPAMSVEGRAALPGRSHLRPRVDRATALAPAVVRAGSGSIWSYTGTITLPVEAIDVQDLATARVVVGYDPAVLQVAGFQRNPAFNVTVSNQEFDRDEDGVPDAVNFVVVSMDGLSAGEGAPLNLANIAWTVVGGPDPGTTSTLDVEVPEFYGDDDGVPFPISASAENGQITVGIAHVRVSDIMGIAANWGQPATGDNEQLDLVLDGIIDVQDVSTLAEHWRGTWP